MSQDSILLIGAEQVQLAAGRIEGAATKMQHAADNFDQAVQRHEVFLTEWLTRVELVIGQGNKP